MNNYKKPPIREWVAEDRPREKMYAKGVEALTEAELLATIIASGTRELSAIDLGRELIDKFGGLRNLSRATLAELRQIPGVGPAKASSIAAAFELARRKLSNEHFRINFRCSADIANYLLPKIGDLHQEVFYVVSLDRQNNIVGEKEIHRGGTAHVSVDARIVFKEALGKQASSIVICHNHPSGSVVPSKADDDLTSYLVGVSKIMGIPILDHLIVARRSWYSYADQGRIKQMMLEIGYDEDEPIPARKARTSS